MLGGLGSWLGWFCSPLSPWLSVEVWVRATQMQNSRLRECVLCTIKSLERQHEFPDLSWRALCHVGRVFLFPGRISPLQLSTSTTSHQPEEHDSLLSVHPFLMGLTELTITKELLFSKNNISLGSLWQTTTPVLDSADREFAKGVRMHTDASSGPRSPQWRRTSREDVEVTLQDCWLLKSQRLRA